MRATAIAFAVLILAGCGGGGPSTRQAARTTQTRLAQNDAEVRIALGLPARVPLRAEGKAAAADVRVVRTWLDRLRAGDVAGAAVLFAVPSRFQNLASVAIIRSRRQAEAINASLPCGARLLSAGGAAGFVVYRARLTKRPGGECGSGTGGTARGAILIRDGLIAEWYRLPDVDTQSGDGGDGGGSEPPVITGPEV